MTYYRFLFGPSRLRAAVVFLLAFAWVVMGGGLAFAQSGGLFVVSKVAVDVTAKDAVTAKQQAHSQARRSALRTVFKRLAPFSAYERLPVVAAGKIEEMLVNFSVRSEQNSATQYLATLDFEFNPDSVRRLLSGQNVPYSDIQAGRTTVLPIYLVDGKVDGTGRGPWRGAWLGLDLEHAVTPVKLVGHGTALNAEAVAAITAGDVAAFQALSAKYKTDTLVLAIAEVAAGGPKATIKLYGLDSVGPIAMVRSERVYNGDLKSAARRAAALSLAILEGRWKITKIVPDSGSPDAARHSVLLTVEFRSLKQWQQIKRRLGKVPGVQALEVGSLSARSADVTLRFPGGAQGLAGKLAAHKMSLSNVGGVMVLRSTE